MKKDNRVREERSKPKRKARKRTIERVDLRSRSQIVIENVAAEVEDTISFPALHKRKVQELLSGI